MKSISKELIGASAAPIILSVLKNGDNYGYEIVLKVKQLTNDEIRWKEASIYPVLKKLESRGLIRSYWEKADNDRHRKYYTILPEGKKQFEHNMHEWELIHSLFGKLWNLST